MTMLKQMALAAFAAIAASTASAGPRPGGCDEWMCGSNGSSIQGTLLSGSTLEPGKPTVETVILPGGEIIDLRQHP